MDLTKFVNTDVFSESDKYLFQQIRKLQDSEINKYLNRNSPFSGIWENIIQNEGEELPDETKALIAEYLHPKLKKIFEEQSSNYFTFKLDEKKKFITNNLNEITLSTECITPVFKVVVSNKHLEMICMVKIGKETIPFSNNQCQSNLVFLYDDVMYTWQKTEDILQAEKFLQQGNVKLTKADWIKNYKKLFYHSPKIMK